MLRTGAPLSLISRLTIFWDAATLTQCTGGLIYMPCFLFHYLFLITVFYVKYYEQCFCWSCFALAGHHSNKISLFLFLRCQIYFKIRSYNQIPHFLVQIFPQVLLFSNSNTGTLWSLQGFVWSLYLSLFSKTWKFPLKQLNFLCDYK